MIWGGKLSVDPDRAKGFQGIRGDPSERRPGNEFIAAGDRAVFFQTKPRRAEALPGNCWRPFWTQESIRRKISDETCLKTFGPADPSDFREISPDPSCGLIAASLSLHFWRTPV
jgi:hypothetical protein